jgi:3-deoxy-D-manno-octulosonic-acid transferase
LPFGGQNLIEPCALARPVIVGPHTYNFSEAAESAIAAGAALRVADAGEALATAAGLDATTRREMGRKGREFVQAHRGAVQRLVDWIEETARPKR